MGAEGADWAMGSETIILAEEDEEDCQEEVDKMKFLAWVQSRFGKSVSSIFVFRTPLPPASSSFSLLHVLRNDQIPSYSMLKDHFLLHHSCIGHRRR